MDEAILLLELKLYLNITWKDDNTDDRLIGILRRGASYLKDIAGEELIDFEEDQLAQSLLFDYCRYENSHAIEMFEENFRGKLLRLNSKYQSKNMLKERECGLENKI